MAKPIDDKAVILHHDGIGFLYKISGPNVNKKTYKVKDKTFYIRKDLITASDIDLSSIPISVQFPNGTVIPLKEMMNIYTSLTDILNLWNERHD